MHRTTIPAYLLISCLYVLGPTNASAMDDYQRQFLWDESNSYMAAARNSDDFALAANRYALLVDAGVRNGTLFYNLGTALIKAERYRDAEKALLRAERYMGSNWDIRHNLLIARAGNEKDETASLPWYRLFLFWHYGLSCQTRIGIAVVAFMLLWVGLMFRRLHLRKSANILTVASIAILALFGTSAATSLVQEARDLEQWQMTGTQPNAEPTSGGDRQ